MDIHPFFSGQVFVIVWRESLEALLIIGILYAYLVKTEPKALWAMWAGSAAGLVVSGVLAAAILSANQWLEGNAQIYFEAGILLLSAVLMTQMVFWMRKHARGLKAEVEASVEKAVSHSRLWNVALVACLAVGREGSEAVIYVYGLSLEQHLHRLGMVTEIGLGLAASLLTVWAVSHGIRFLKKGIFFNITSLVLLLSAASLGTAAIGKLVAENIVPGVIEPLWDWSHWLSADNGLITAVKLVVGYNPRPSLLEVLAYVAYWVLVAAWFFYKSTPQEKPARKYSLKETGIRA